MQAKGKSFELVVKEKLNRLCGWNLKEQQPIGVGHNAIWRPSHRFDLVDEKNKIIIECKDFTWTKSNKVPSAKMSILREALLYLILAPKEYTKILCIKYAPRVSNSPLHSAFHTYYETTIATYFHRCNWNLIGPVYIYETNDTKTEHKKEILYLLNVPLKCVSN